jgi:Tol biopolymer transport system component
VSWSADGRFLLYSSVGGETKSDLWVLPLEGDQKRVPFAQTKFDEPDGRFSPDGHWVAYVSNESGRYEVYVRRFFAGASGTEAASGGGKTLISTEGGEDPMWRRDGKALYYIDPARNLISVEIQAGAEFQVDAPKMLFQAPPRVSYDMSLNQWALAPDGNRFLFLAPDARGEAPVTVVLNWQAGMKR